MPELMIQMFEKNRMFLILNLIQGYREKDFRKPLFETYGSVGGKRSGALNFWGGSTYRPDDLTLQVIQN